MSREALLLLWRMLPSSRVRLGWRVARPGSVADRVTPSAARSQATEAAWCPRPVPRASCGGQSSSEKSCI